MTLDHFHHRWVPGFPDIAPLLMLHGTGGDEGSMTQMAAALAPGASIIAPRGRVSEGTANRFFRRFSEGDLDLEDLVLRVNELADWLVVAAGAYHFEPGNLIAIGYSNGANVASSLMLLRPEAIKAAAAWRPMAPLSPSPLPNLIGKSVLLTAGLEDHICPMQGAKDLAALFDSAGANVQLETLPQGHALSQFDTDITRAWLRGIQ